MLNEVDPARQLPMTSEPSNPIAATIHADPYPYYARLAREMPLYHDDALGLWVVSSAEAVTAVLTNPSCRVRPPGEQVPKVLLGSAAGDVFRRLMRMNDGDRHVPLKHAASETMASVDPSRAEREGRRWARVLAMPLAATQKPGLLTRFQFDLPVHVMGTLIGLPDDALARLARLVGEFVRCLAPGSRPEEVESGKVAAAELLVLFRAVVADDRVGASNTLLATFARQAKRAGPADLEAVAANGIGLLFQTYEATAGLIGNTLLALARDPGLRDAVRDDPDALRGIVDEVVRFDPSIQNTRRWIATPGTVAGRGMAAGDAVLVVLAAANRDPSGNPDPDLFDPLRRDRRSFTFGIGDHACPGERLATGIAVAGVEQVLASGSDLDLVARPVSYHPSANVRIPLL
jgi:cytochrome P450